MHHNTASSPSDSRNAHHRLRDLLFLGFAWIVTLASIVAGVAPRALVVLYICAAVIIGTSLMASGPWLKAKTANDRFLQLAVLFAAFIGLSSLWSANMVQALLPAGLILLLSAVFFVPELVKNFSDLQLHRTARGILVGFFIALCFVLIEYVTDFSLRKAVMSSFPGLIKSKIAAYDLNRNTSMLVLFLWPALLVIRAWTPKIIGGLFIALIFASLLIILSLTVSETAQLTFIVSLLAFWGAYFAPGFMFNTIRVLWVGAIILVVPLMLLLGDTGLHTKSWLIQSARHRIIIWDYTANKVPQNPILGIGIHSDRYAKGKTPTKKDIGLKEKYSQKGWHPHNMYLQIWYELGAVGAAFVLAIGLLLLNRIRQLNSGQRPYALATFATFATMAATGWGMWQFWLLASHGWAIVFFVIASEYASRSDKAEF